MSMPAKKWEPYVGYAPKKSTARAVSTETPSDVAKTKTDSLSSARAKSWSPPIGLSIYYAHTTLYIYIYYVCMYACMHVCIGYVPSGSRPAQAVESKKWTPPISQVL